MASLIYNSFKSFVASAGHNWSASAPGVKAVLVSSYVPAASHIYASAFSGQELSSTSYTGGYGGTGRLSLVSTFISTNNGLLVGSAGRSELGASASTWSGHSAGTACAVVLVLESATGVTNNGNTLLVAYIDTGGFPIVTNGGDLTIQWASNGVLQLT